MSYPSNIDSPQGTTAAGTSLLATVDHALDHRTLGSAVVAIENKVGLNSGSAAANQILVGQGAGSSTWQQTWNQASLGSPTITAGTIVGQVQNNGTVANGVYGTATYQGGTANAITLGTPTLQGSVVNTTNIVDAAVIERKMKMDILGGTTLSSGTTASNSLVDIAGGSVTITLPVASNVMIYFTGNFSNSGGGSPIFALLTDGVKDSIWTDTWSWIGSDTASTGVSFTAWRTGLSAASHTWKMQWRTGAGTITLNALELIVQPFSQ